MWIHLRDAEIPMISGSLAYSTLFSLIPFLAVALAVIKGVSGLEYLGPKFEGLFVSFLRDNVGADAGQVLKKLLHRLSVASWGFTSAIALFVTSMGIFLKLERAVNMIWEFPRLRPLWARIALSILFYALVPLGLAIYAGIKSVETLKPIFKANPLLWDGIVIFLILMIMNRVLPAVRVRWSAAFIGSAISTVGLIALKGSFALLTAKVFDYSKVYGGLAALPLLCFYILTAWYIVLIGVAFAASLTIPARGARAVPGNLSNTRRGK